MIEQGNKKHGGMREAFPRSAVFGFMPLHFRAAFEQYLSGVGNFDAQPIQQFPDVYKRQGHADLYSGGGGHPGRCEVPADHCLYLCDLRGCLLYTSEYSLLYGACRIRDLPKKVQELGQDAVAITDHGCMYGVVDFYKACKKEGVKPIIGCEVYVAPRTRFDKVHQVDSRPYHLVLLLSLIHIWWRWSPTCGAAICFTACSRNWTRCGTRG